MKTKNKFDYAFELTPLLDLFMLAVLIFSLAAGQREKRVRTEVAQEIDQKSQQISDRDNTIRDLERKNAEIAINVYWSSNSQIFWQNRGEWSCFNRFQESGDIFIKRKSLPAQKNYILTKFRNERVSDAEKEDLEMFVTRVKDHLEKKSSQLTIQESADVVHEIKIDGQNLDINGENKPFRRQLLFSRLNAIYDEGVKFRGYRNKTIRFFIIAPPHADAETTRVRDIICFSKFSNAKIDILYL